MAFNSCKQKETCSVTESKATFYVKELTHNFGDNLSINKEYTYDFVYFNTGKTPLIINDIKTSCHCTTADYTKEPLRPGESAKIHVMLKEQIHGYFRRSITVFTNSAKKKTFLYITGNIKDE